MSRDPSGSAPSPSSGPSLREASWFTWGGGAGAFGGSGVVMSRIMEQRKASGGAPTGQQRLIAMLAAQKAQAKGGPNSVAAGVVPNIRALHTLMGNYGSAFIGDVFKSAAMQKEMVKPIARGGVADLVRSMMATGGLEFGYWKHVQAGKGFVAPGVNVPAATPTLANFIGGVLGSAVKPTPRAMLQSVGKMAPKTLQGVAAMGVVSAASAAGAAVGGMMDQVKTSSTKT